ncbi:MAG: phospholipase D-like domain-containing protein [Candidatus Paceibacteria bacterium]
MKYKFFTSSKKAWRGMYQDITKATQSIFLEMYIFEDNTELDFVTLFIQKARSGVKVKLLFDKFGSYGLSDKSIKLLQKEGIEIYFFSQFWHRVHRKILIIDGRIAFIGGVNIYQHAASALDLMVRVEGKIAYQAARIFAKDYEIVGGKDARVLTFRRKKSFKKIKAWFIEHSPFRKKFALKQAYVKEIGNANKTVVIITPYFAPNRTFIALLHQAILRGVEVKILIPQKTEHIFLDKCNYFYLSKIASLGVQCFMLPQRNHAKVLLIDDNLALVGSQNADFLSMELNAEAGIMITDTPTVQKIHVIFNRWQSNAVLFDNRVFVISRIDRILAYILRFFISLL